MDTNTAVASAAIGAIVATVTTLVVHQSQKVKDAKAAQAETTAAQAAGYQKGWYEGRESILQQFQQQVTPQDFADRR